MAKVPVNDCCKVIGPQLAIQYIDTCPPPITIIIDSLCVNCPSFASQIPQSALLQLSCPRKQSFALKLYSFSNFIPGPFTFKIIFRSLYSTVMPHYCKGGSCTQWFSSTGGLAGHRLHCVQYHRQQALGRAKAAAAREKLALACLKKRKEALQRARDLIKEKRQAAEVSLQPKAYFL